MYPTSEEKLGNALKSDRNEVVLAAKRLAREGVKAWIGKAMESAAQCIECGECEQKCPYHLPISDLLKENLALYNQYARSLVHV